MSKKPVESASKPVMTLSEYGRVCLQSLKQKIREAKPKNKVELNRFFWWECGFSDSSLDRLIASMPDVTSTHQLFKAMKKMCLEDLFLLINGVRGPNAEVEAAIANVEETKGAVEAAKANLEATKLMELPLGLVQEILKGTLFVQGNEARSTAITGVSGCGPSQVYLDAMKMYPDKLQRAHQMMLEDRLLSMLQVQADLCPEDTCMILTVSCIDADPFTDFDARQWDIALQKAILQLTAKEEDRYVGVLLGVRKTAHSDYNNRISTNARLNSYNAFEGESCLKIVINPNSLSSVLGKFPAVDIVKAVGKIEHIKVAVSDWMRPFDEPLEDTIVSCKISRPELAKLMPLVEKKQKKLGEFLVEELVEGAIKPGRFREVIRDRLDVCFPGLGERAEHHYAALQEVFKLKEVDETAIDQLLEDYEQDLKKVSALLEAKKIAQQAEKINQLHSSGLNVVDDAGHRADFLGESINFLETRKVKRQLSYDAAINKARGYRVKIPPEVSKRKQNIQIKWTNECDVHIELVEPSRREDLMRGAITPGPFRKRIARRLLALYPDLRDQLEKMYAVMKQIDGTRADADQESFDSKFSEIQLGQDGIEDTHELLLVKQGELKKEKKKSVPSEQRINEFNVAIRGAKSVRSIQQKKLAELIRSPLNKIALGTEDSKSAVYAAWEKVCYEHMADIEKIEQKKGRVSERKNRRRSGRRKSTIEEICQKDGTNLSSSASTALQQFT